MSGAVVGLSAAACSRPAPFVWASRVPSQAPDERLLRIERGDKISVVVSEHPELSGQYVVAPDGTFLQPLVGPVAVAGHKIDDAGTMLSSRLTPYLSSPSVTVSLIDLRAIRVNILGEVKTSGTYELEHGDGLLAVLAQAGGLSEFADEDAIYLLRPGRQPARIRFRYSDLVQPGLRQSRFVVQDGDTVLVE